jgi:hypothetical protein
LAKRKPFCSPVPTSVSVLGPRYALRLEDLQATDAVEIECPACRRCALVAPHRLHDRFAGFERMTQICRRMRCRRCGSAGGMGWTSCGRHPKAGALADGLRSATFAISHSYHSILRQRSRGLKVARQGVHQAVGVGVVIPHVRRDAQPAAADGDVDVVTGQPGDEVGGSAFG